jgi:uncharacterized protein YfaP (DUF2135 family)
VGAVVFGACSSSVPADTGADAAMQLTHARFVRGAMPEGSPAGPAVASVDLVNDDIAPLLSNDPIAGNLGANATSAAIGLQGDVGYWIVVAGVPNVATPTDPSFATSAAFSSGISAGEYTLVVRAVDDEGHFGPPSTQTLTSTASTTPTGALVVTLTWDTESDMDLHVVDPLGDEIFHGDMSSEPPFQVDPPDGGASYGYLDWDSNAGCVIDGKREEDVIWPPTPPSGAYLVRVDAASLCGQSIAHWKVDVLLDGVTIATASGVAVDADTRGDHDRGAGVLALQFSAP